MRPSNPRVPSWPFLLLLLIPASLASAQGRFPPDSLVNVKALPSTLTPIQVIGQMRNITSALGARCQYCHEGQEGQPLNTFDFVSDAKRTKQVAREMIRMVAMINARLDTLPGRESNGLRVTCATCHRGVTRPIPLSALIADVTRTAGADSALRAYRQLRERHYGGDAYDFRVESLNLAASGLGRSGNFDEAFLILDFNESQYPGSADIAFFRGNIHLMRADTTAAEGSFRNALRLDPNHAEARGRLRNIGRTP